MKLVIVK